MGAMIFNDCSDVLFIGGGMGSCRHPSGFRGGDEPHISVE
jgi:hypothetical protein